MYYNLQERDLWNNAKEDGSSRFWNTCGLGKRAGKKSKRKDYRKTEEIGDFSLTDPCETETTQEKGLCG